MPARTRIVVIAAGSSKSYQTARGLDQCEVVARGYRRGDLEDAVASLETIDADLVLLSGHGSIRQGPRLYASDRDGAAWAEFAPSGVASPRLLLDMCFGGAHEFVRAVHHANPGVEVLGPNGLVSNAESRALVPAILRRFAAGGELKSALRLAKAEAGYERSSLWE